MQDGANVMAAQSRTLRNSLISLAIFFALVAALLLGVPGLHAAAERIARREPGWVLLAVALEAALLCRLRGAVRAGLRPAGRQPLLAPVAVGAGGQLGGVGRAGSAGIALGAWVLRSRGFSVERIAKRSVLIFVLTSAVNVGAVVVIGIPMWLGCSPARRNPLLTLVPALAAIATIAATLALAAWARRRRRRRAGRGGRTGDRADRDERRRRGCPGADPRARLAAARGRVGYWLFDNLVLYACL